MTRRLPDPRCIVVSVHRVLLETGTDRTRSGRLRFTYAEIEFATGAVQSLFGIQAVYRKICGLPGRVARLQGMLFGPVLLLRTGDHGKLTPQHVLCEASREMSHHRLRRGRQRHDGIHSAVQTLDDGNLVHLWRHEAIGEARRERERIHVGRRRMMSERVEELGVFRRRRRRERWSRVDGHAATSAGGRVVPHVGAHVHLQVALRRECLPADVTLERLVSGVRAHVDLQRTRARERFLANQAHVLEVRTAHERRLTVIAGRAWWRHVVLRVRRIAVTFRLCIMYRHCLEFR